jgi:adenine-specific DNA-methyltransferase
LEKEGKVRLKCSKCGYIHYTDDWGKCPRCNEDKPVIEILLDTETISESWLDIPGYSQTWDFQTENSEILLKRVIESTSNEGDLVMDFFLGSGTTTAVAHKLGRKWIGVEMGEHFWTVVLPRIKKVLAYDKSGISKEKDIKDKYNEKTAGGLFKYQILEQYEDALDNIELVSNKQAELKFGDDYLLKYFLDYETRENPSLLNIDQLKNPFSYKLKVNPEEVGEPQEMIVDIPETFNYLLGLKVKKIKAKYSPLKKGNKYLFVLGEKEAKDVAIVWREYNDNWTEDDFKKDKEFIIQELEPWSPYVVYVNGQSVLTPEIGKHTAEIHYIEPEFKKLME